MTPTGRKASPSPSTAVAPSPTPSGALATPTPGPQASLSTAATATATPAPKPSAGLLIGSVRIAPAILKDVAGVTLGPGAAIIGNNGSGLISDKGGEVISDNGGGLIGNHGASYHLAGEDVVAQIQLAGAVVALCDAAGTPLTAPDGHGYTATTDATGRYAFAALPALPRNATIQVALPGDRGALTAFVPRDPAPGAAVDVDLVSTLTTTYVLDRYVKGQADPNVTYDRLPGDVEAKTRAVTADALHTPPARLDAATVVATVNALRVQDAALDAQLETVRQILLLAGQADGGAGRPALSVALGGVDQLDLGPGGDLYFVSHSDRRLYRVDASGTLRVVAGTGVTTPTFDVVKGKPATDVALGWAIRAVLDAEGAIWLLDGIGNVGEISRLGHIATDGTYTELWRDAGLPSSAPAVYGLGPDGTGGVNLLAHVTARTIFGVKLLHATAAGVVTTTATLPDVNSGVYGALASLADGKFVFEDGQALRTFVPPDYHETGTPIGSNAFQVSVSNDMHGRTFLSPNTGNFQVASVGPDGQLAPFATTRPSGLPTGQLIAIAEATPGRWYASVDDVIYRVENGMATRIAGGAAAAASTTGALATDQALQGPTGVIAAPGGGYVIGDLHSIFRVDSGGHATKATDTDFALRDLAVDPDGTIYGFKNQSILALAPDNTVTTRYTSGVNDILGILRRDDDGALIFGVMGVSTPWKIERLAPGAATPTVLGTGNGYLSGFARATDGSLWALTQSLYNASAPEIGTSTLLQFVTGQPARTVSTDTGLREALFSGGAGLLLDAKGRAYFLYQKQFGQTPVITRFDPADGSFTPLTGPAGVAFKGASADDTLGMVNGLAFFPNGDLVFADYDHRQVRRLAKALLPP